MTIIRKLRQRYDTFTVVERVNLVLAAQERGDEEEVHALENYCPVAQSLEYEKRMLRLMHATSVLVVQLLAHEVLIGKRFDDLVNAARNAKQNAKHNAKGVAANPSLNDPDDNIARCNIGNDDQLASLLERTAAIWHGFSAWCRDLGHDPHQVLRLAPMGPDDGDPAFFIVHQQIEYFERWAHDLLHDLDEMETWRELFTRAFQSMAGASREQ